MTTNSSGGAHIPDYASWVMREKERNNRWSLKDLGAEWTIDVASAAMAAGLVAPIVTVVDKYAFVWEPFAMIQIIVRTRLAE